MEILKTINWTEVLVALIVGGVGILGKDLITGWINKRASRATDEANAKKITQEAEQIEANIYDSRIRFVLDKLENFNQKLTEQIETLHQQINTLEEENTQLRKQANAQGKIIQQIVRERETLREENAGLKTSLEHERNQRRLKEGTLQQKLDILQKEFDALKNQHMEQGLLISQMQERSLESDAKLPG